MRPRQMTIDVAVAGGTGTGADRLFGRRRAKHGGRRSGCPIRLGARWRKFMAYERLFDGFGAAIAGGPGVLHRL
jgi:hypothetical protein